MDLWLAVFVDLANEDSYTAVEQSKETAQRLAIDLLLAELYAKEPLTEEENKRLGRIEELRLEGNTEDAYGLARIYLEELGTLVRLVEVRNVESPDNFEGGALSRWLEQGGAGGGSDPDYPTVTIVAI